MKYMLLIHSNEIDEANLPQEELGALFARHTEFSKELATQGKMRHGAPLQPTSTATTVRYTPGETVLVTDGPFAETKEQFGGYYMVDCADLDEALALAKRLATFSGTLPCSVEVRPVLEIPGM